MKQNFSIEIIFSVSKPRIPRPFSQAFFLDFGTYDLLNEIIKVFDTLEVVLNYWIEEILRIWLVCTEEPLYYLDSVETLV